MLFYAIRNKKAIKDFTDRYGEKLEQELKNKKLEEIKKKKSSNILENNLMSYSVETLKNALRNLKKSSMYKGKISG